MKEKIENNLDKDIEIVKEIITHKDDYDVFFGYRFAKPYSVGAEEIQAISNVLLELETYKKIVDEKNKELNEENLRCSKLAVENNDLKEKLETYKKIAEKLAEVIERKFADKYSGIDVNKYKCKQSILGWARKEVNNEK